MAHNQTVCTKLSAVQVKDLDRYADLLGVCRSSALRELVKHMRTWIDTLENVIREKETDMDLRKESRQSATDEA